MAAQPVPSSQRWFDRYQGLVAWLTLACLLVGGVWGYFFIGRPTLVLQEKNSELTQELKEESRKNQQLIDKKISEAEAISKTFGPTLEQIKAQVELTKAQTDKIYDKVQQKTDTAKMEITLNEQAMTNDRLIESIIPNFQVNQKPNPQLGESSIIVGFTLINNSEWPIKVEGTQASVILFSSNNQYPLPTERQIHSSICNVGFMSSKDSVSCDVIIRSDVSLNGVSRLKLNASFSARTQLRRPSAVLRRLRDIGVTREEITRRMSKRIDFNSDVEFTR